MGFGSGGRARVGHTILKVFKNVLRHGTLSKNRNRVLWGKFLVHTENIDGGAEVVLKIDEEIWYKFLPIHGLSGVPAIPPGFPYYYRSISIFSN